MYSPRVTAISLASLMASTGLKLSPTSLGDAEDRIPDLDRKNPALEKSAPLTKDDKRFIRNEILYSKCDFNYWVERYAKLDLSGTAGGGVGPVRWWETQRVILSRIAGAEQASWEAYERGEPVEGCRLADHKSRQGGSTSISRLIAMHRLTLWKDQRMLAASQDENGRLNLYNKDKLIFDNLPWWMRPSISASDGGYDVKGEHIRTASSNSFVLYRDSSQKAGVGIGSQFDVAHLTECSSWPYAEVDIEHHFFPTVAQPSVWTVCILESTAQGIGDAGPGDWWCEFIAAVRRGEKPGWIFVFVPWYAEPTLYRRSPPIGWAPNEMTLLHAAKCEETSVEYLGRRVVPSREQLYWYETSRAAASKAGTLNLFLADYCATVEESFQHSGHSAFSTELLERLSLHTSMGVAYDLTDTTMVPARPA